MAPATDKELVMHILKCALGGAAFASSAVVAAAITWTLVQKHRDERHMTEYWQRRRLEDAKSSHHGAIILPIQRPAPVVETIADVAEPA